ncbi:MAG: MFS transporter [Clostridia bacterium]|nr:MFS transporter [Clostridia bacterium]
MTHSEERTRTAGRLTRVMMLVFIVMNFVINMSGAVFGGILDQVAQQLSITEAETGMLSSVYAWGAGIGVPVFLIVFRRFERTVLLKCMLAATIAATVVMLHAESYSMLLVTRFIMGLTGSCYGVLATSTIASLSDEKRIGGALAKSIAGAALALVVGIPLTRALSGVLNWKDVFRILMGLMAAAFVYFMAALRKDPKPSSPSSIKSEFRFFRDRKVLLVLASNVITFTGYGAFYAYITPYLLDRIPALEPYMSVVLAAIGCCAFAGNLIGGKLCDRIGYRKALILGSLLQAIIAAVILATGNAGWINLIPVLLWIGIGWLIGLQTNTGINVATERKSSFMVSLCSSGGSIGSAIGTSIAAQIMAGIGIRYIIIVSVITSATVLLMGSLFRARETTSAKACAIPGNSVPAE